MSNIMSNECVATDVQIKEHAKELFFVLGNLQATSQEIADFVGVKRTLVNYYFRSKENLLHIVYLEIIDDMKRELNEVYVSKVTFKKKVAALIDTVLAFRLRFPFFEIFNTNEVGNKMQNKMSIMQPQPSAKMMYFIKEIEDAMQQGIVQKSNPYNFLLNIMSLVSYPITMKPLYVDVYGITVDDYDKILQDRKELILALLFKK
jgi:TetR/AcrR family transcriptional regulator